MHWTYADEIDADQLHQGDVLSRTPELDDLLLQVHSYFQRRVDNLYFMVLTQSCDLVRRPQAKADYLALCPVRPVKSIVSRALGKIVPTTNGGIPVGSMKDKGRFEDFLARLFNNNEPGLFYLFRDELFGEDCCAFTRLSISIRTEEHYDKCLRAKTVQLSEPFRAKLGWSVGNIYSRVGTQDWDKGALLNRIAEAQESSIVWVSDEKEQKSLIREINALHETGEDVTQQKIKLLGKSRTSKREQLVALVGELMVTAGVENVQREKVEKRLKNDPMLSQLIRT